jgi:hypothetical protein
MLKNGGPPRGRPTGGSFHGKEGYLRSAIPGHMKSLPDSGEKYQIVPKGISKKRIR